MVYGYLLEQLHRQVELGQLAAIMVQASGGQAPEPTTFDEAQGNLDAMLCAEVKYRDRDEIELRQALRLPY